MVHRQAKDEERAPSDIETVSRRYSAVLLRYFQRRGIAHCDAQDLAQEVFVRLARQSSLDGVGSVESYLFAAAANVARDMYRRNKVRTDHPAAEFVDALQITNQASPEQELSGREELDCILAALNEMPERMRTIFILARLENMPRAEIAARLGVSKSTVEQSITLATACLAERRERLA